MPIIQDLTSQKVHNFKPKQKNGTKLLKNQILVLLLLKEKPYLNFKIYKISYQYKKNKINTVLILIIPIKKIILIKKIIQIKRSHKNS